MGKIDYAENIQVVHFIEIFTQKLKMFYRIRGSKSDKHQSASHFPYSPRFPRSTCSTEVIMKQFYRMISTKVVLCYIIIVITAIMLFALHDIRIYFVMTPKSSLRKENNNQVSSFVLHTPENEFTKAVHAFANQNLLSESTQSVNLKQDREHDRSEQAYETEILACLDAAVEMELSGKYDKALKLFQHAFNLQPNNPEVLIQFGEYMEKHLRNVVEADYLYSRALTHQPEHTKALLNRERTSKIVQDIDRLSLEKIDHKRNKLAQIPNTDAAFRHIKQEAYYHYIYHTVNIEGNTMTLAQTRSILETKMAVGGKSIVEHNEILGLDIALKYINISLVQKIGAITIEDILEIHRKVMCFVDPDQAGKLRQTQVFIANHVPPPPSALPSQLAEFLDWLNTDSLQMHPIECAALAHYKLVYLHPFLDGNGRTSRLLMNLILMQAGYPPTIIPKQDRLRYYECLKMANDGDVRPFIRFIAECTDRTLDVYLWATSEYEGNLPALVQEVEQPIISQL